MSSSKPECSATMDMHFLSYQLERGSREREPQMFTSRYLDRASASTESAASGKWLADWTLLDHIAQLIEVAVAAEVPLIGFSTTGHDLTKHTVAFLATMRLFCIFVMLVLCNEFFQRHRHDYHLTAGSLHSSSVTLGARTQADSHTNVAVVPTRESKSLSFFPIQCK